VGPENAPLKITTSAEVTVYNFEGASAAYLGFVFSINLDWFPVSQLNLKLVITCLLKPRMGVTLS
jgi:hypothetical protein